MAMLQCWIPNELFFQLAPDYRVVTALLCSILPLKPYPEIHPHMLLWVHLQQSTGVTAKVLEDKLISFADRQKTKFCVTGEGEQDHNTSKWLLSLIICFISWITLPFLTFLYRRNTLIVWNVFPKTLYTIVIISSDFFLTYKSFYIAPIRDSI